MKRSPLMYFAVVMVLTGLLIGCGGKSTIVQVPQTETKQGLAVELPAQYEMNYAADTTAIYGKGTALTTDMQVSVDKANLIAAAELATMLERHVERYRTLLTRPGTETGSIEDEYKAAVKEVADQTLIGTEEHYRKIFNENGKYRAYVVLKLPVGTANKALLDKIKKDERLWQMYQNEKLLKELEEAVAKYKAERGETPQG